MVFADRVDAGRQLARHLEHLRPEHPVVVGLPRGGVPVAAQIARALEAPLDVILVRKIGLPSQRELAMGAIGEGGVRIVNDDVVRATGVTDADFDAVERAERVELERRGEQYRGTRARIPLESRTTIVVDDGIATGSTARAACAVARELHARHVVLAAPVAPSSEVPALREIADEVVFVETPDDMGAVGHWYRNFAATSDAEVVALLREHGGIT